MAISVDGAFKGDRPGAGVLARDERGEGGGNGSCKIDSSGGLLSRQTAGFMEIAQQLRFSKLVMESDCLSLVNRIQGRKPDLLDIGHLVEALHKVFKENFNWNIRYINRKINTPSHLLRQIIC